MGVNFFFKSQSFSVWCLIALLIGKEVFKDHDLSHGDDEDAQSLAHRPEQHPFVHVLRPLPGLGLAQPVVSLVVYDGVEIFMDLLWWWLHLLEVVAEWERGYTYKREWKKTHTHSHTRERERTMIHTHERKKNDSHTHERKKNDSHIHTHEIAREREGGTPTCVIAV